MRKKVFLKNEIFFSSLYIGLKAKTEEDLSKKTEEFFDELEKLLKKFSCKNWSYNFEQDSDIED
jgi:hypothetical protein